MAARRQSCTRAGRLTHVGAGEHLSNRGGSLRWVHLVVIRSQLNLRVRQHSDP